MKKAIQSILCIILCVSMLCSAAVCMDLTRSQSLCITKDHMLTVYVDYNLAGKTSFTPADFPDLGAKAVYAFYKYTAADQENYQLGLLLCFDKPVADFAALAEQLSQLPYVLLVDEGFYTPLDSVVTLNETDVTLLTGETVQLKRTKYVSYAERPDWFTYTVTPADYDKGNTYLPEDFPQLPVLNLKNASDGIRATLSEESFVQVLEGVTALCAREDISGVCYGFFQQTAQYFTKVWTVDDASIASVATTGEYSLEAAVTGQKLGKTTVHFYNNGDFLTEQASCTLRVVSADAPVGDMDYNGKLAASDVLMLLQMIVGNVEFDLVGDVNDDGKLNSMDVLCMLQLLVGNDVPRS